MSRKQRAASEPVNPQLETSLRQVLAGRAGSASVPKANNDDLMARIARANRHRQRALSGLAAATLVVGGLVGYLGGVARAGTAAHVSAGPVLRSSSSTTVPSGVPGRFGVNAGAGQAQNSAGQGLAQPTPAYMCSGAAEAQWTLLFTRVTSDGIDIRAYRSAGCPVLYRPGSTSIGTASTGTGSAPTPGPTPGPMIPACQVAGSLEVELSDSAAVGQGSTYWAPISTSPSTHGPLETVGTGVFGFQEGSPAWWVAATVGPTVAKAQVTFSDGSTDSMAPVKGAVALASQVKVTGPPAASPSGTLVVFDASGAQIGSYKFPTSPVALPAGSTPGPPATGSGGSATASGGSIAPSGTGSITPSDGSGSSQPQIACPSDCCYYPCSGNAFSACPEQAAPAGPSG